jgi:hypothetical protein
VRASDPQKIRNVVLGQRDDERDASMSRFGEEPGYQRQRPVDDLPSLIPAGPRRSDVCSTSLPGAEDLGRRGRHVGRVEQQEVDGAGEPGQEGRREVSEGDVDGGDRRRSGGFFFGSLRMRPQSGAGVPGREGGNVDREQGRLPSPPSPSPFRKFFVSLFFCFEPPRGMEDVPVGDQPGRGGYDVAAADAELEDAVWSRWR